MAICAYCGAKTQLYSNGVPICLKCARPRRTKASDDDGIQAALLEALSQAILRADTACSEFESISSEIPSGIPQPDRSKLIHNASRRLTQSRDKMVRARTRLNDYVDHGIVPEDLKRSG